MIRSVKTAVLGAVMAVAVAGIAGAQTSTNPATKREVRDLRRDHRDLVQRPARRACGRARPPRRQARRSPGRQVGPVQGRAAGPPRRQPRPPGHRRRQARHPRRQAGHSSGSPAHRQPVTRRRAEAPSGTHGPPKAPPPVPQVAPAAWGAGYVLAQFPPSAKALQRLDLGRVSGLGLNPPRLAAKRALVAGSSFGERSLAAITARWP